MFGSALVIVIITVAIIIYIATSNAEDFPEYYHAACFECNEGQGACKGCKYNYKEIK